MFRGGGMGPQCMSRVKHLVTGLAKDKPLPSSESTLQLCTLQNLIIDTISIIIMRKVGKQSALLSKDIIYCCLYGVSVYRAECQLPSPGSAGSSESVGTNLPPWPRHVQPLGTSTISPYARNAICCVPMCDIFVTSFL